MHPALDTPPCCPRVVLHKYEAIQRTIFLRVCVSCTLSLEGVQIMSEGVCWFTLLQHTKVSQFLHLCFLCLPLPHCDHHLIKAHKKVKSYIK